MKTKLYFTFFFICLTVFRPAYAQISELKLTASDAAAGDNFGWWVSISGDYAVVGAQHDDDNGC